MTELKKHNNIFNENDFEILPLNQSETIPSVWYTSKEIFEFEQSGLFQEEWHLICHLSQLKNIGDFVLGEAAGNSVIVLKDNEEKIRAFYNVCRHRGGPLAMENGCANILQCKYHGWTYTLEGMLRGIPRFDRVDLFDKKDYGLVKINVDIYEGLVFVNLSETPKPLKVLLNGISERIKPNDLKKKNFHQRIVYDVKGNWKVYVDNYLEGYHVPFVHPELTNFLDYKEYVTEISENYSLQFSPIKKEKNYLKQEGGAYYYFLFPNIMLNILPGRLQTNIVIPVDNKNCKVIFDFYYDDFKREELTEIIKDDLDYSDKVQAEDIEICEKVQKGLESKAYDKGRFSVECEEGVYHFQCLLKKSHKKYISGN